MFGSTYKGALLALMVLLLFSTQVFSKEREYHWKSRYVAKNKEQISTYTSVVKGQDIKAFKGVILLPYSRFAVLEAITDVQTYPYWIYQCQSTSLSIPQDQDANTFYMEFNGFWFVADRDVIIQSDIWRDKDTNVIHVTATHLNNVYPKQPDFVRVRELDNRWQILSRDDGWTEVHFQTFINIGGRLPSWIANIIATDAPKKTLKGLRKLLDTGAYNANHFDDIEQLSPKSRSQL